MTIDAANERAGEHRKRLPVRSEDGDGDVDDAGGCRLLPCQRPSARTCSSKASNASLRIGTSPSIAWCATSISARRWSIWKSNSTWPEPVSIRSTRAPKRIVRPQSLGLLPFATTVMLPRS